MTSFPPDRRLPCLAIRVSERTLSAVPRAATLALVLTLVGCSRPAVAPLTSIPTAIVTPAKPVGEIATEWSGMARTKQAALLAFSVAGRVQAVRADVGDLVAPGTVLMELDAEPFQLQLRQAEAEAAAAIPALAEAIRRRDVEQRLWAKNATSQAAYEAAESAYAAAVGRATATEANVALARRALREAKLVAPVAGRIARRLVSNATFVLADTVAIEFDPADATEIVVAVPGPQLADIRLGQPIEVRYRLTEPGANLTRGTITHIGQRRLAGGVHEVLVSLPDSSEIAAGEPVAVRLPSSRRTGEVLVPVSAVRLTGNGLGEVLVLGPDTGVLKARLVSVGQPDGSDLLITAGLQAGERVVATGTSFLREGNKIRAITRE